MEMFVDIWESLCPPQNVVQMNKLNSGQAWKGN